MKILIIQTAFIGDVVLATPLIEKLKAKYPGSTVNFLLRKGNENLLESHPKLDKLLIWNKETGKFKNLLRLIRQIRSERYDLLINVQRFGATGLMTWFSNAKEKIGFSKNFFSFLYTKKIKHEIKNGIHEVERNLKLIEHLTGRDYILPKLYPPKEASEKVGSYQNKPYLVFAPASVWFTKQLPEEKWIEVLKNITFNGNIFLIGGSADFMLCQRIIEQSGKGRNLSGELSLMESAVLIAGAKMNYVNDSAPMHLASAVNAPTCAIFCSTVPDFGFGPLAENSRVIEVEEALECRPCGLHGKKECPRGHFKCGRNVNASQLVKTLECLNDRR